MNKTGRIIAKVVGSIIIAGAVGGYAVGCANQISAEKEIDECDKQIKEQYAIVASGEDFMKEVGEARASYRLMYEKGAIDAETLQELVDHTTSEQYMDAYMASHGLAENFNAIKQLKQEKSDKKQERDGSLGGAYASLFGGGIIGGAVLAVGSFTETSESDKKNKDNEAGVNIQ